jgi:SAM-dependent methyltransferase
MSDKLFTWEEAVIWLRNQPHQAELVRACFYDDPLSNAAKRYYSSSEWQAIRLVLPRTPGLALDIGAGRGISSYALARDGWQVCALEPDPSNLVGAGAIRSLAQEEKLTIHVEENWGESLPYPDMTFDLVHGRQVLHHAHDLKRLCSEVARVLKPGGRFIAIREHVISKKSDLPKFLAKHPLQPLYGGEHAYLLDEYQEAIRKGGISLTETLTPYQSDINLYPETTTSLKQRWACRLRLPPAFIPDSLFTLLDAMNNTPGRLYSFVGRKND